MTRISPAELDARQRVRAAILPRGRQGYAVPRVARVSPGCRARQRVWPRTLAKIRAHGRGWVKTGHFAGFALSAAPLFSSASAPTLLYLEDNTEYELTS